MAGKVKGITIEFRGDTTKLHKAIREVQSDTYKTNNELKQINRSLKFNPKNIDLLRQKQSLLNTKIEETEKSLDQLKSAQKQLDASGVDKNSADYRRLQREIIKTENQLKTAEAELKRFGTIGKQQAIAVGNQFKAMGNKIKGAGSSITRNVSAYGAAAIYAGAKLIEMSEAQAQAEEKLSEIYQKRLGVGKKAVQATLDLAAAEQKTGVVGDEVQIAGAQQLATYAKFPGTVNAILPALNDLLVQQKGLSATQEDAVGIANLFGKAMMGQTGALKRVGISFSEEQEKILKYGTEEERAAVLAEVVSQNVGDMNQRFAETDSGKIQQAKNALGDMGEEIGAVLLPAVADFVGWLQENVLPAIEDFIGWLKEHPQVAKFALALAAITAAGGPLLMLVGSMVTAVGTLIVAVTSLDVAMAPIALVILGITAAIAAAIAIGVLLYKNWDAIKTKAVEIKESISEAWNGIKKRVTDSVKALKNTVANVFNKIKSIATKTWNGIKNAITSPIKTAVNLVRNAINKIKNIINMAKLKLPKIKLPHFSLKGKLSLVPPSVPTISVDWYKTGGIFNKPTIAGIGEAGPEAVIPIDKLKEYISEAMRGASNDMANAVSTGLAISNTVPAQQPIQITINLGGTKVAEQIVRLYDTGKRQVG